MFLLSLPVLRLPKTKNASHMDVAFIRDFLMANNDRIALKTLVAVISFAKNAGMSVFPLVKRVFFDT